MPSVQTGLIFFGQCVKVLSTALLLGLCLLYLLPPNYSCDSGTRNQPLPNLQDCFHVISACPEAPGQLGLQTLDGSALLGRSASGATQWWTLWLAY